MKHQRVLTSGLVISAIVNIGFLAGSFAFNLQRRFCLFFIAGSLSGI
jgi:hypothetical protein